MISLLYHKLLFPTRTAPRPVLKEIIPLINVITKPHLLGIQLDVPAREWKMFEKNYPNDVERQMTEVITYWQNNTADCSWEALANAVEQMGNYGNLVERLRKLHSKHVQVENVDSSEVSMVVSKTVEKAASKAR